MDLACDMICKVQLDCGIWVDMKPFLMEEVFQAPGGCARNQESAASTRSHILDWREKCRCNGLQQLNVVAALQGKKSGVVFHAVGKVVDCYNAESLRPVTAPDM